MLVVWVYWHFSLRKNNKLLKVVWLHNSIITKNNNNNSHKNSPLLGNYYMLEQNSRYIIIV